MEYKSLLTYLENLASQLRLTENEKERIENSISTIKDKISATFNEDGLSIARPFGSYDRGTLISRRIAKESDVDILIIFKKQKLEAQTYLNKLKQFAETYYPRSESYQDHPTIVIELNHIKFELVPCIFEEGIFSDSYYIPKLKRGQVTWIETEPDEHKKRINDRNPTAKTQLIKLILLFKYWNTVNESSYITTDIERLVLRYFDEDDNIFLNLINCIANLHYYRDDPEQQKFNRAAKKYKENIKYLLDKSMEDYALQELQKLLPPIRE